jgi:thiol-disulfide isomerase/thioredoxin
MPERIAIAIVLIGLGWIGYHAFTWWSLRRATSLVGQRDPLLDTFLPGRPAILYFTSINCVACHTTQKPMLTQLQHTFGEDLIQIIQVDVDQEVDAAQRWGVMSLPTTYVLDSNGTPHSVNYGVASTQKLRKQLEAVHPTVYHKA